PAAALERMENASDRTQAIEILGDLAPLGQHVAQVADLFLEFLEEDLADLVVDLVASGFETAGAAGAHGRRRMGWRCRDRRSSGSRRHRRLRCLEAGWFQGQATSLDR